MSVIQEPRTRVFHSPWQNSLEAANTPQGRSLQTQYGVKLHVGQRGDRLGSDIRKHEVIPKQTIP